MMEPLRFAIVGAGNIGKMHAQAISALSGGRLTVVCDSAESRGRSLADTYDARWTPDYRHAVVQEDVDVVCVCTPSGTHADIAIAAAEAHKHLVVEKPMDITLPRIDAILQAAKCNGVKLTCIFPLRFSAGVREAKQALDQGRLGKVLLISAFVRWYRSQAYYSGTWRGTRALDGGGALLNQSIHTIDLLQWMGGPADTTYGYTATRAHEMETEDTASAVVKFQSGAMGIIQGATSCWPGEPARLELHGDRGTIVIEEGRVVRWSLRDAEADEERRVLSAEAAQGSGSADPMGFSDERHRRQIGDMIDAIRVDREPEISGSEARKAVELILAIYRSAEIGCAVTLRLPAES